MHDKQVEEFIQGAEQALMDQFKGLARWNKECGYGVASLEVVEQIRKNTETMLEILKQL